MTPFTKAVRWTRDRSRAPHRGVERALATVTAVQIVRAGSESRSGSQFRFLFASARDHQKRHHGLRVGARGGTTSFAMSENAFGVIGAVFDMPFTVSNANRSATDGAIA